MENEQFDGPEQQPQRRIEVTDGTNPGNTDPEKGSELKKAIGKIRLRPTDSELRIEQLR